MITERTLKKWRKEALNEKTRLVNIIGEDNEDTKVLAEFTGRILRLTQILLDQHLMKGK